ncbi:MAG: hypothetical protein WBQ14_00830 [Gaiellaceae bacterium]
MLSLLEISHGDGFDQVGIDQLLAGAFQFLQATLLGEEQFLIGLFGLGDLISHCGSDHLNEFWCQFLLLPVPKHMLFHQLCWQVRHVAVGAFLGVTQAEEVGIGTASALRVAEAQTALTLSAEQSSLEIVLVAPGTIPGDSSGFQYALNLMPGCRISQWRVIAFVLHPTVRKSPYVVRAGKDTVDLAAAQRYWASGSRRPGLHTSASEFLNQITDRPIS